jgi:hypothetical protein
LGDLALIPSCIWQLLKAPWTHGNRPLGVFITRSRRAKRREPPRSAKLACAILSASESSRDESFPALSFQILFFTMNLNRAAL